MKKNAINMTPLQPYLLIDSEHYKKYIVEEMGISHFYEFQVEKGKKHPVRAVPDGSVDLLFGIGDKDVITYLGGTVLKVKDWPMEEDRKYFGVRFQPGKCILPKDLSVKDVVNAEVKIDGNCYGDGLTEKLAQAKDIIERGEIFTQSYMKILRKSERKDTVYNLEDYMRQRIYETSGTITIQKLSEETGYSECYIRRIFGSVHGISPKSFEKFVRFQNVIKTMKNQNISLEEIVQQCGYYDQSHMIKDFKIFSGMTPEAYRNMGIILPEIIKK